MVHSPHWLTAQENIGAAKVPLRLPCRCLLLGCQPNSQLVLALWVCEALQALHWGVHRPSNCRSAKDASV